ncbi:hypothetical protein RUR49_12370 [Pseudoxanthobacter sp. M-2]|uniref:hypothetical protein n=1 Tax=Pseudoxanthobacter sp. M-2 TaxID=3078754 RepID=UPI0038FCDA14
MNVKSGIDVKADDLEVLWGARSIAQPLGVSERRAFYMLETGAIPGAKKVAGRWAITRARLRELFEAE